MTAGSYFLLLVIRLAIPAALFMVMVSFGLWLASFTWFAQELDDALSQ
jgi:hypothetical protein